MRDLFRICILQQSLVKMRFDFRRFVPSKDGITHSPEEFTSNEAVPPLDGALVRYEPCVGSVVSPIHRGVESACCYVNAGDQKSFLKVRNPDMAAFLMKQLFLRARIVMRDQQLHTIN